MIKYNTIIRNFKTFDNFIVHYFDGLSAHTLYQTHTKDIHMAKQFFSNTVYTLVTMLLALNGSRTMLIHGSIDT